METKNCPYCGKVVSGNAIICRYCHQLFNDADIQDNVTYTSAPLEEIPEENTYEENIETQDISDYEQDGHYDDETTKVYRTVNADEDTYDETDDEQQIDEDVYARYADSDEENIEEDNADDYEYSYEETDEEVYDNNEDGYSDYDSSFNEYGENISTEDSRRTFMITAIITIGILIIIIAAVAVGYKLFGFDDSSTTESTVIPVPEAVTTTTVAETETATESVEEYVPAVTDDTLSEAPEEVYDSSLSDPVSETDSTSDSAITDSSTDSLSSSTDSASDSSALDSNSSTDSSAGTTSVSDTTSRTPAGSYFSWDEVMEIMNDYVAANGGSYSYSYGTDGVEMVFNYTDDNGNTSVLRVDLPTGAISTIG